MSALNVFKTVTASITTTPTTVYTAPSNYTAIILMAQITNITSTTGTVTFTHFDGTKTIHLLKDFAVPGNDAVAATVGKLVLQQTQTVQVSANANGTFELTLSILESANG